MPIFSCLKIDIEYMMIIEEKERAFFKLVIQGKTKIVWYFTFFIYFVKRKFSIYAFVLNFK